MHEEGDGPPSTLHRTRLTILKLQPVGGETKGNLTSAEQNFLQTLYEVRMAYVEVTQRAARPPKAPAKSTGT